MDRLCTQHSRECVFSGSRVTKRSPSGPCDSAPEHPQDYRQDPPLYQERDRPFLCNYGCQNTDRYREVYFFCQSAYAALQAEGPTYRSTRVLLGPTRNPYRSARPSTERNGLRLTDNYPRYNSYLVLRLSQVSKQVQSMSQFANQSILSPTI
jgi:hypothetical protein